MSMEISLARVGIYKEDSLSIKSPDPLIMWSCKATENILPALSLLSQGLWSLKLAR